MSENTRRVEEAELRLDDLKNGLTGRPSWLVSMVITFLASALLGLVGIMVGGRI